ncbi:hypothetical protein [Saccharothrix obliqua]|uniref:hypothetical protein n=1 Tax=Saccharothrix obliqua TaxID=2861747 RepID=UPI001C5FEF47|nr:hypothetical protein [Saccharothrix obliqua]MBW4717798.1 hypothetical protein [Saccharothrix obliqua]
MPATQTLVSTALPNGVRAVDGRPFLFLSAYLTPRLVGSDRLATFPDLLAWPDTPIAFDVRIGTAAPVRATPAGPGRRADLWRKLFRDNAPVTDHRGAPDITPETTYVRSYPVRGVHHFVRGQYAAIAAHNPAEHPRLDDYSEPRGRDGEGKPTYLLHTTWLSPEAKRAAVARLREVLAATHVLDGRTAEELARTADLSAQQLNFLLAEQFHDRRPEHNPGGPRDTAGDGPVTAPNPDFHLVLGALGQYPALLRLLGLVHDLRVPLPDPVPAGPVGVSVTPVWTPRADPGQVQTLPPVVTVTECVITGTTFTPAARDALVAGGLLRLDAADFDVTELDTDAAAVKLLAFAETMSRTTIGEHPDRRPAPDSPDAEPPPALQSGGLSINHTGRARRVFATVVQAQALQGGQHLFAEDITRGLRIDVRDDTTGKWHSLCLRDGVYTFAGAEVAASDEGVVTTAHTTQSDDASRTFYLHESLVRWTGYSLVAPRPGRAIDNGGGVVDGGSTAPGEHFDLRTAFRAKPGTLPKLRFGRTYRFRARTADLAGNGPTVADPPGDTGASEPVTYYRFEPVAAPTVLFRKPRTEGESAERMVLRSDVDTPPAADCQRHLAPTRISQLMAEQHGLFDVPPNPLMPGGMNKAAYDLIRERDTGSFDRGGTPDGDSYGIPFFDTDRLAVPYLPDVLSRGAAFTGLPGTGADEVVTVDFDFGLLGAWPDARPFRVRLVEGEGKPDFDALFRVLTVRVPKGRTFEVRYRSRVDAADLALLGQWAWLVRAVRSGEVTPPPGTTLDSLRDSAVLGRMWLLTPYRTLTLVHATKRPVSPPVFAKPVAVRLPGQTYARVIDQLRFDRASTGKVDLEATWTEWVDLPDRPAPVNRPGSAHAFQVVAESADPTDTLLPVDRTHEFHDTKHRKVTYTPIGTTRFAECFVERAKVRPTGVEPVKVADGIAPGTDIVRGKDITYVRGADYAVDYAAGTISRVGDAIPSGAEVEVAHVPPPITSAGVAVTVDVPSSARPTAPDVAYVVPTFGWRTETSERGITRTRQGNGLRVFLRRPWYSSGDGEQLGVLTADDGSRAADLTRYTTRWAQDPAWRSTAVTRPPAVTDFPLAAHPRSGLALAEGEKDETIADATVSVAPHDVVYDTERGLWFCDVVLTPPQPAPYRPFIRLALARYQPVSLHGVELSTVVQAQFAQLDPDRALTVVDTDATRIAVTVVGVGYTEVKAGTAAVVTATVQTADPALSGNVRWSSGTAPVVLEREVSGGQTFWRGTLTLPAPRGSRPLRLVVEETEKPREGGERLVYADAVEL